MERTLASWGSDFLDGPKGSQKQLAPGAQEQRAQLLFLLAWFHAVVQERRTYLPQGWSKAYEFSIGDLRAGAMVLDAAASNPAAASSDGGLDFKLIHGLMEDAIYGGRIDKPSDLRVLRTYVVQLYSPKMLQGRLDLTRGVKPPPSFQHGDLMHWCANQLPDEDAPGLFGLPDNIQRAVQRSASTAIASQLRSLSVSGAADRKFDREAWKLALGPLIDLWDQLLKGENLKSSANSTGPGGKQSGGSSSPTDQFVVFENAEATALCLFVDGEVAALKRVLLGSALLTSGLQAVGSALLKGEVPPAWEKKWEGPETVSSWMGVLVAKKKALTRWAQSVGQGRLLQEALNLSELFNPGAPLGVHPTLQLGFLDPRPVPAKSKP